MNTEKSRAMIFELLSSGMKSAWEKASIDLSGSEIYSFSLFAASGLRSIACAVNTKRDLPGLVHKLNESEKETLILLQDHPDLLKDYQRNRPDISLYAEVSACEWAHFYTDLKEFDSIEHIVHEMWERSHDSSENVNIVEELMPVVIKAILDFRSSITESEDILLGLQFSDPDEVELDRMIQVSSSVNSEVWHLKVVKAWKQES
ncbi:hypothetical protein [Cerasicoccus maritimus]|uniref:hypothetical protein n=1 Tax=Cerasicoccus maritimus TaxID=490089 RepID=UPI002852B028|nr:hypothetical protein [Cerasicoccus maritimus]